MNRCTIRISKQRSSHNSHRRPLIERALPRSPGLDSRPRSERNVAGRDEGTDTGTLAATAGEGEGRGKEAENRSCRRDFKAAYAADDDEGGNRAETRGGGEGEQGGGGGGEGGSNQRIGKLYGRTAGGAGGGGAGGGVGWDGRGNR